MRHYIGLIHKDADSDFGVSFPDLPGLVTAGTTLDEARDMAEEVLAFHLEGMAEDGEQSQGLPRSKISCRSLENRSGVAIRSR